MKSLFILGVAINDYPQPGHRLQGCVADRDNLTDYLKQRYSSSFEKIHLFTLTNEQATRQGIIKAFNHFNAAQTEDTCLFYFAGHGSRLKAPVAFHHLEVDQKLKTIVCYDSRSEGGTDLLDKELSYLIWSVTKHRNQAPHFLAIMDCCHSSTNTRNEFNQEIRQRSVRESEQSNNDLNYLGINQYQKNTKGQLTPPKANHILIAASLAHQTAKEVRTTEGEIRGAFTYCLLEYLQQSTIIPSYQQLIDYVALRIKRVVKNQMPVLETFRAVDKETSFLTGELLAEEEIFLVSYSPIHKWFVNIGSIQGISLSTSEDALNFQLINDGHRISTTKVLVDKCLVSGMEEMGYNKFKIYEAILNAHQNQRITVSFEKSVAKKVKAELVRMSNKSNNQIFRISDSEIGTFVIHQKKEHLWLSIDNKHEPLFPLTALVNHLPPQIFFSNCCKVINWFYLRDLENSTQEKLSASTFKIELWRREITLKSETFLFVENPKVDQEINLNYQNSRLPAFRVKVTNTSPQPLWFCSFYLGNDYSISDELLPAQRLDSMRSTWLTYHHDTYSTNDIQVVINEPTHQNRVRKIHEYLKFIVSAQYLNSQYFNQAKVNTVSSTRSYRRLNTPPKNMYWITSTIHLAIQRD